MSEKRAKLFVVKEIIELSGQGTEEELLKFTFQSLCKMKKDIVDKKKTAMVTVADDEPFWSPWHCEYRDNN